ncbi:MAG TPA: D-2-hydroxyacid dehydrogenase family protein [Solirubrobacteraceae bacterium]|nr:D-2-hydroxyacid dehydrogenase family protein [Solirubrobacteraceae bacterium]
MTRVAILDDYQDVARRFADWDRLGAEVVVFTEHRDDIDHLESFDVIMAMRERTPFPRERLERLPNLKLLVTTGMGNAAIDTEAARELGITVAGTGGTPTHTAELTWGLILALARQIPREDAGVRAGGWQQTVGFELAGRTLGVIGLGRLGTQVARIGEAFGMDVIAWSQNMDTALTKAELLGRSDVVTIHVRLSERSRGLIGAEELALMKPTAYLVNTSRGPIVDEGALLAALANGQIAGAGIDVYDTEPLPADHPLRSAPNTVLTPHIGYVTDASYARFFQDAVEDIAAWQRGEPLRVIN